MNIAKLDRKVLYVGSEQVKDAGDCLSMSCSKDDTLGCTFGLFRRLVFCGATQAFSLEALEATRRSVVRRIDPPPEPGFARREARCDKNDGSETPAAGS